MNRIKGFGLGAVIQEKDIRDYTLAPQALRATSFPNAFSLKRMPEIKNQGGVGSCVAHACSYISEYFNGEKFGTDFVYGYRPTGYYQGVGMYVRDACKTLIELGNILYKDLSSNTEIPLSINKILPNINKYKPLALPYTSLSYAAIEGENQIKASLMNNMPVIITVHVYNDFSANRVNGVLINSSSTKKVGAHAMAIFGWSTINNQTHFLVANSWGTSWGKQGFCYIPASMISDRLITAELFAITDNYEEGSNKIIRRTLRRGMKGEDVRELQSKLISLGYNMPKFGADGSFGAETYNAVILYQKKNKLVADGIVGKKTWESLDRE